jgi:hypothetical protein
MATTRISRPTEHIDDGGGAGDLWPWSHHAALREGASEEEEEAAVVALS